MADKLVVQSYWQELYLEMLANPTDYRTDASFLDEAKVPRTTFYAWKAKNRAAIYNEVQRRRSLYLNELRSTAWKELANKMKKDVNAIKLAFQLTGDLVERTENKHEYMTRQDKIDRMDALLREINDKKETWKKVKDAQPGVVSSESNSDVGNVPLGNEPRKDMPDSGTV